MIILPYNRWGILVPLLCILCPLAMIAGISLITDDPLLFQTSKWPKLAICYFTAAVLWLTGRAFNRNDPKWVKLDSPPEDRYVVATGSRNSFFSIPMEYWGPIIAFFGTVVIFAP